MHCVWGGNAGFGVLVQAGCSSCSAGRGWRCWGAKWAGVGHVRTKSVVLPSNSLIVKERVDDFVNCHIRAFVDREVAFLGT